MTPKRLGPLLADLVCVLALAIGGMNSHEAGDSDWVVLAIAWPFALAAVLAHVLLWWRGRPSSRIWPGGVTVLTIAYVLGMLLRALSGRGLAPGFLVVAATFLAVTMLGWRGAVRLAERSRASRAS
jgi:Protein of unknown function (DUF3054)